MVRATALCLIGFLLCGSYSLSAVAAPDESPSCRIEISNKSVKAEVCDLSPSTGQRKKNNLVVRVTLADQKRKSPTVIAAQFTYVKESRSKNHFWSRLWIESGSGVVTAEDQKALGLELLADRTEPLDSNVEALTRFLVDFVEPGTRIENFDAITQFGGKFWEGYEMICEFVGQYKEAAFTAEQFITSVLMPVGFVESNCRGRCGAGCPKYVFPWYEQYTQECLNHDACRDFTGAQLGQCSDEFWIAAEGFVLAPNCDF